MIAPPLPVIAVTGLLAEARIAAGPGVVAVSGGGDAEQLRMTLHTAIASGARAVISFGIAGGLSPEVRAGDIVVADCVDDGVTIWPTDPQWRARLVQSLTEAKRGAFAGSNRAVAGVPAKAALHRRSGAVAVDMESHVAARVAAEYGIPFAALRVIADPAERALPEAALVGMRPDGSTDVWAVIRALARQPDDLAGLIKTALDARAAFSALRVARGLLDADLGAGDGLSTESGRETEAIPVFGADPALAEVTPDRA